MSARVQTRDTRTLAEREADAEADLVPNDWERWGRFRGTLEQLLAGGGTFTRHERGASRVELPARRLRGSQDYSTLHLGRGTKWVKAGGAT